MEGDCCEKSYTCPGSGERECLDHGGFDVCCGHPECPGARPTLISRAKFGFMGWWVNFLDSFDNAIDHLPRFWHDEEQPWNKGWEFSRYGYWGCHFFNLTGYADTLATQYGVEFKPTPDRCFWCHQRYIEQDEDD